MDNKPYKRHIYIVNKPLQYRYVGLLISMLLIAVFSVAFTTFYVIWANVIDAFFFVPEASKKLADIFTKTSVLLILPIGLLALIFFVVGVIFSHKIAGPLYRVERVAEELGKGNLGVTVKFRKGDELHPLADKLNYMIQGIRGMVKEDKEIIGSLTKISGKLSNDVTRQKGLKKDVKSTILKLNKIVDKLKKSTDRYTV